MLFRLLGPKNNCCASASIFVTHPSISFLCLFGLYQFLSFLARVLLLIFPSFVAVHVRTQRMWSSGLSSIWFHALLWKDRDVPEQSHASECPQMEVLIFWSIFGPDWILFLNEITNPSMACHGFFLCRCPCSGVLLYVNTVYWLAERWYLESRYRPIWFPQICLWWQKNLSF